MTNSQLQEDRDRKIAQADRDLELALAPFVKERLGAKVFTMESYIYKSLGENEETKRLLEQERNEELHKIWDDFDKAACPFEEAYDRAVKEAMEEK